MTRVAESFWRCDLDGESFGAVWTVVARDGAGSEIEPPPGLDVKLDSPLPCPICGEPMRRVVSLLDLRDWEAQFAIDPPLDV